MQPPPPGPSGGSLGQGRDAEKGRCSLLPDLPLAPHVRQVAKRCRKWWSDSQVGKRYSQAKRNMMREALARLDRQANEHEETSGTAMPNLKDFWSGSWQTSRGLGRLRKASTHSTSRT